MANEILSYIDVCLREKTNLQRGMNYKLGGNFSVILMSVRPNAPYKDRFEEDGTILIYEGHDESRRNSELPKAVNQPEFLPSGKLTENGKFHRAAQDFKNGLRPAEFVRVYEKLYPGIWSDNGVFQLIDSWQELDGKRSVFKFKLIGFNESEIEADVKTSSFAERRRLIPTEIKIEVWRRDNGKCTICNASDELHFDHIIPYAKGGTSLKTDNVQILCARHNLEKSDKIQ